MTVEICQRLADGNRNDDQSNQHKRIHDGCNQVRKDVVNVENDCNDTVQFCDTSLHLLACHGKTAFANAAYHTECPNQNLRSCLITRDDLGDEVCGETDDAEEADSLQNSDTLESDPEGSVITHD